MVGATANTTTTTTTNTGLGANAQDHTAQHAPLLASTTYLCNSCHITFQDGQEQRTHMKTPWHVINVKRRTASLPPISLDEFDIKPEKKAERKAGKKIIPIEDPVISRDNGADDEVTDSGSDESSSPFQCLFCNQDFSSDKAGFTNNLEHMHTAHGLNIPDSDTVMDMQSLVGYLATEVRTWHECLYCGASKPSTTSIQSHMRDKGHCRLNFDREPELLDFWESRPSDEEDDDSTTVPEQARSSDVSATEMHFPSGRVIGARNTTSAPKKTSQKRTIPASTILALSADSEDVETPIPEAAPRPAPGRQLARREEMGILGISDQQRHALVLAEKKAQRSEAAARRAREWVYAKGANLQKYDQVDGKMKMGKQNHKLQPR